MSKNIQMQEKTSSGYDILYPQTIAAQIEDVYSKDETITTATKALYGLGATATPNQVFSAISTALDGKARIQTGSYVGTGTYGESNPCSLTFDFKVKLLYILLPYQNMGPTIALWQQGMNKGVTLMINGNNYEYYSDSKHEIRITQSNLIISYYAKISDYFQFNCVSKIYYYGGIG